MTARSQSNCGMQPPAQRARWLGEITECGIKNSKSEIRNRQSAMGNRGFTLIEIIVLIVMAGILLPAIIIPFATGIRGSGKPELVTTAMYLAHQKMEEFMKYNYCNAALNPTALTSYADITGFSGYQWQWSIYHVDSNFQNQDLVTDRGYKRILVRVSDPMLSIYEIYSVVTRW